MNAMKGLLLVSVGAVLFIIGILYGYSKGSREVKLNAALMQSVYAHYLDTLLRDLPSSSYDQKKVRTFLLTMLGIGLDQYDTRMKDWDARIPLAFIVSEHMRVEMDKVRKTFASYLPDDPQSQKP